MIGDSNAAVGPLNPLSSRITNQIATDENIWLWECVPAYLCLISAPVQLQANEASLLPGPATPAGGECVWNYFQLLISWQNVVHFLGRSTHIHCLQSFVPCANIHLMASFLMSVMISEFRVYLSLMICWGFWMTHTVIWTLSALANLLFFVLLMVKDTYKLELACFDIYVYSYCCMIIFVQHKTEPTYRPFLASSTHQLNPLLSYFFIFLWLHNSWRCFGLFFVFF